MTKQCRCRRWPLPAVRLGGALLRRPLACRDGVAGAERQRKKCLVWKHQSGGHWGCQPLTQHLTNERRAKRNHCAQQQKSLRSSKEKAPALHRPISRTGVEPVGPAAAVPPLMPLLGRSNAPNRLELPPLLLRNYDGTKGPYPCAGYGALSKTRSEPRGLLGGGGGRCQQQRCAVVRQRPLPRCTLADNV